MTLGSSVSKSQSAMGSSSNSEMLLILAVPCRMESKALCATPPGLRQWIESSSGPPVVLVMPQALEHSTMTSVETVLQAFLTHCTQVIPSGALRLPEPVNDFQLRTSIHCIDLGKLFYKAYSMTHLLAEDDW